MVAVENVIEAVCAAKEIISSPEYTGRITEKGVADYVTGVDIAVQHKIKNELNALYPEIQFIGEEEGEQNADFSKPHWILDPIDGTTNLIHGFPCYTVSLALCRDGETVLGIVYHPCADTVYYAVRGGGAFSLNVNRKKEIRVSTAQSLEKSLVSIGTTPYHKANVEPNCKRFANVLKKAQDIRRTGSAALELAYVACGITDGFFEKLLRPWDFAAGILLVTEAGGKVTTFEGDNVCADKTNSIAATNGMIHAELLSALNI